MRPSEEQLAFYLHIGMAITQWAQVEDGLYRVATACLDKSDAKIFNVAFFSVENFRSKLHVVDSMLSAKFKNTLHFAAWASLYKRAESASKARNALAHHWMLIYMDGKPGRRCGLLPRLSATHKPDARHKHKPPAGALFVRDISLIGARFSSLSNALLNFAFRLRGQPAPLPESLEQEGGPQTLREIRRLIHVFAGPPPRSSPK